MNLQVESSLTPFDCTPQNSVNLPLDGVCSKRNAFSLLEPLRALQHPSLITSVYPLTIGGVRHEITKSLVLGKRAGGVPMRVSLFGGLDPGHTETISAVVKLLMLLTLGPSLSQDYAVFGYPLVHPGGFEDNKTPCELSPGELALRWKLDAEAHDALFFRAEFQRISPHGIITLRSTEKTNSLRAHVNSSVIAQDVVAPALRRLRTLVPVEADPVMIIPRDEAGRQARFLAGHLSPYPETQPWPFEIEIEVPAQATSEEKIQVLVLAILDILRSYRTFLCHGGEL